MFGGLLVGQALRAAYLAVAPTRPARSLHAWFIRPGSSEEPIRYAVDRTNDGTRFTARRVLARSATIPCSTMPER